MSEAKYTRIICVGCGQLVKPDQYHPMECCYSFQAGQQDQAAFDQLNFDKERKEFWSKIAEAKQEGMQEIVDWVGEYGRMTYAKATGEVTFDHINYTNFLKEKGLK